MSNWSDSDIHELVEKAGLDGFDYTGEAAVCYDCGEDFNRCKCDLRPLLGEISQADMEWAKKIIKEREGE